MDGSGAEPGLLSAGGDTGPPLSRHAKQTVQPPGLELNRPAGVDAADAGDAGRPPPDGPSPPVALNLSRSMSTLGIDIIVGQALDDLEAERVDLPEVLRLVASIAWRQGFSAAEQASPR